MKMMNEVSYLPFTVLSNYNDFDTLKNLTYFKISINGRK